MKSIAINASLRENLGKKDSAHLRRQGNVPCVLYGGKEQVHFVAPEPAFKGLVYTPNVYTVDLTIGEKNYKAVMQDIQFHAITEKIMHIDFLELHPDTPTVMNIPVKLNGSAVGVREGGELVTKIRKLKVKALPANLPDTIELNIEHLTVGKSIRVSDVKIKDCEVLDFPNNVIVAVRTARVYVEEKVAAPATGAAAPTAEVATAAPTTDKAAPKNAAAPEKKAAKK